MLFFEVMMNRKHQITRIYMGLKIIIRHLLSKKKYRNAFKFLFILLFILLLYNSYIFTVEHFFFHLNYITVLENNPHVDPNNKICVLPSLDPWDERVKQYFFKVPPVTCQQIQPYLTHVTQDGILQWNRSEPNLDELTAQLECDYQEILKDPNSDDKIKLSEVKKFTGNTPLTNAFVKIICTKDGNHFYHNIHAWLPPKIIENVTKSSRTSIQIFILDAVSQPNFIRQLPSTYNVLTQEMSSIILTGVVKLGCNTFPNIGALLTGNYVYDPKLPNHDESFDSWPFLWKNFSDVGYVTIFGEDVPEYNTFNYLDTGFKKQPTDIYMRPFWLSMLDDRRSSEHCFGNSLQTRIMIDYLKTCTESLRGYPFFMMTNLMQMSHDEMNLLQNLDVDLTEYLRWFRQTSTNTILIVMSDHGINFGPFRSTQLGRVESAFPFFAISLPESLSKSYPHLERNLRANRRRMSTFYDVHDTLMDVSMLRYDKPRHPWSEYGFSLFYQLPVDRTCQSTGIPSEYCPCEIEIPLGSNSSKDIELAAQALVSDVNRKLSVEPRCPPLSLLEIKSAIKVLPNGSTAKAKGFVNIYRIVVNVLPSRAFLEAKMQNDAWVKVFVVVGSVTRVDKFGNSTRCVADKNLRNFCYCNN
uniref:DUF229 domain-containing protein n=1 Tax=Strigamia maritima TaxID=126957 RepID=T1IPH4_STRMM